MQRKKLLALPLPQELKPEQIKTPANISPCRWDYSTHYYYTAALAVSEAETVLVLDVFYETKHSFAFRFFTDGANWFSVNDSGKLSEASLSNTDKNWRGMSYHHADLDSENVIKMFCAACGRFKKDELERMDGASLIINLCDLIRAERLEAKYRKRREELERELAELKRVPEEFFDWVHSDVMAFSRYMFADLSGRSKEVNARCSVCDDEVRIARPRLGDRVFCPSCGAECTVKSLKMHIKSVNFADFAYASYAEPLSGRRFCIHDFYVRYVYYGGAWQGGKPERFTTQKNIWEEKRTVFQFKNNGELLFLRAFEPSHDSRLGAWRHSSSDGTYPGRVYPETLNGIFKNAPCFKRWHLDYNLIARRVDNISANRLYEFSRIGASLHNLVNGGLTKLASDLIGRLETYSGYDGINIGSGRLTKALGVSKDELSLLRGLNPSFDEFNVYKTIKGSGKKLGEKELLDYFTINKLTGHSLNHESIAKLGTLHQFNRFFMRNFPRFRSVAPAKRFEQFMLDYKDYISAAMKLRYDLSDLDILYPRNFKYAHDTATAIVTDREFKKGELPQIARQYPVYREKFYYEDEEFIVTPPTRHADLKWEGKLLNHCVATYAKNVAEGKTIILFIRKKSEPGKPYFTLNISPTDYKQIQCRGQSNCDYPTNVAEFLKKWRKEVITPLKKEEKKCRKAAS